MGSEMCIRDRNTAARVSLNNTRATEACLLLSDNEVIDSIPNSARLRFIISISDAAMIGLRGGN